MPGLNTVCTRYVAVRQAQGEAEWYDWDTIGNTVVVVKLKVDRINSDVYTIPWADCNPVNRIVRIVIKEIGEGKQRAEKKENDHVGNG